MLDTAPLPTRLPADAQVTRWRAPDGWDHRRFDLAGDGRRGRVLLQLGRADVVEKYLDLVEHLHRRGWAVTSFDWRGQGGSGRCGVGDAGHADSFDLYEDDLAAFWATWRAEAPEPHVLVAHSMGGHVALRALAAGRIAPDAVVLSAPMVQVRSPLGQALGGRLAALMRRAGPPGRAAWRISESPGSVERRRRRLTLDSSRGQDSRWWHQDGTLKLGAPSWGWLAEAFRSGTALRRDRRLDRVTTPTLFLVAECDRLVDARAAVGVAARMPAATLVRFGPEAAHEVLREGLPVRDRAYAAIDDFLASRVPA